MDLQHLLKHYDYRLPPELIAQKPASPRDHARLLVYNRSTKKIKFDRFFNIGKYLPKNSILVFNQTKVVPARLKLTKDTGGKVEVLYIANHRGLIKVIANRKLALGQSLTLIPSTSIVHGRELLMYSFKVFQRKDRFYFLKPNFPISQIQSLMSKFGETPLPPYIKNSLLTEKQKRKEYQSIFAKNGLSIAAPTASLHFTRKLIGNLKKQGIEVKFVTLNVNLGTFAPLSNNNLKTGKLHLESYYIAKKTAENLNRAKREGKTIIAVGTTVVRTLESASARHHSRQSGDPQYKLTKLNGSTDLFIHPPYKFQFVDGLITNFHVPKSSLLMLTASLIGQKTLINLYKIAIKRHFRFFSFGDGMIII